MEFTTLTGRKVYLDFLCLLKNDTLCHIEFQYPNAGSKDFDMFFSYNILAQVRYQKIVDSILFNFTSKIGDEKPYKIGETMCFIPFQFYLGDVDFETYIEKINIKV